MWDAAALSVPIYVQADQKSQILSNRTRRCRATKQAKGAREVFRKGGWRARLRIGDFSDLGAIFEPIFKSG